MSSDTAPSLVVAETFGPTFQGEGPSAGRRCCFIRLGGCNLQCSWCDSKFTWDARSHDLRAELTRRPSAGICAEVEAYGVDMVVITGGEPLLHQHQRGWEDLLSWLDRHRYRVEVETNGTLPPTDFTARRVMQFNVSPKLTNSGDPLRKRIRPEAIAALSATGRAVFKFVCTSRVDVEEVASLVDLLELPTRNVWVMPEGRDDATIASVARAIADPVRFHGFNLTLRQHVTVWGDKRGH
jgi:organic radical activating enzyme